MYLTFFYIILIHKQTKKELRLSKTFFLTNLIILFLLAFTQYFLYPDLRNLYYLGYDPHSSRLFGSLLDPNLMGIVTVWGLLYLYYSDFRTRYKLISLSLLTGALLLTYSRISWICFVIAILCITLQKNKKIGLFLIASFALLIFSLPRQLGEGTNIWRTNSITAKVGTFIQVRELFLQSPLFGKGFNTVPLYKTKKDSNGLVTLPDNSKYSYDNSLFTIAVTTGLLGIVSYLYLFWSLFRNTTMPGKILTITFFLHALSTNSFFTPTTFVYFCLFYYFIRMEKRV